MKSIPAAMQAALDSGVTSFARCVKITRADGVVLGFTEHDRDLVIGGVTYRADAALDAASVESPLGLSVSDTDLAGAIAHDALSEGALDNGDFDAARVELFLTDWQSPGERIILRSGELGEVRREGIAFVAELRGLSHRLSQTIGRTYQHLCDAELGDARCGIALTSSAWRGTGTVTAALSRRLITASGLGAYDAGLFEGGVLALTGGAMAGRKIEVRSHGVSAGLATLSLWSDLPALPAAGDDFTVTAGCPKTWQACRTRFANGDNFRGFPFMPGNDWIAVTPRRGGRNDGGKR
ncbi:MAG TPA: DUF2163 domain-containing protein [Micropepsaceae bacterium]|nr:DUF2163 domain-containing protein [Micropepsaceae bacterium]